MRKKKGITKSLSQGNLEENQNMSIEQQEKPTIELEQFPTKTEIEDWQQEIDGNILVEEKLVAVNTIDEKHEYLPKTPENSFLAFKNNKYKRPTTIHIIDGEKGGCGKSFICRAFIEYCHANAHDMVIVDADISNRDIDKIYPNVEMAFFSDDEKQAYEADKIFEFAFTKSVLVNLPAQVYGNVTNWIQRNDLVNLGEEYSIHFTKWFVSTGRVDSVNFFLKSLDDFGDDITHVFVKNYGLCDDWEYVETMPEFLDAVQKYNFYVVDFPKFPFWERNTIDRLSVTFSDAILRPELKIVSKQRVKNFLKFAYNAFSKTGLIQ